MMLLRHRFHHSAQNRLSLATGRISILLAGVLGSGLFDGAICGGFGSVAAIADDEAAPGRPAGAARESKVLDFETLAEQSGPARGLADLPDGVFYLDLHDPANTDDSLLPGSLFRELSRQALLLSAREELGFSTRDRALREDFPWSDEPTEWPLSVVTTIFMDRTATITVLRRTDSDVEILWEESFQLEADAPYVSLAGIVERLSREDFVDLLGGEDYVPQGERQLPSEDAPAAEILDQLSSMNMISQFAAVRGLHSEIRDLGESPQRLGALARGYANLALLTGAFGGPMSKALMARGLLYAERQVQATGASAAALRNRAYVCGLIGLPSSALRDLEGAAGTADAEPTPDWVEPLALACRGDHKGLLEVLSREDSGVLPAILYWDSQRHREDTDVKFQSMGLVLEREPDCLRVMFEVWKVRSLGTKRASESTLQRLPDVVHRRLSEVDGLPVTIATRSRGGAVDTPTGFANLVGKLKESGRGGEDRDEPSLDFLGGLLNEAAFLAVWQVLDFRQNWLDVPIDDAPQLARWAEGHPIARALTARSKRGSAWSRSAAEALRRIRPVEYEFPDYYVSYEFNRADRRLFNRHYAQLYSHFDWTFTEIPLRLGNLRASSRDKALWLAELMRIAPHHAVTLEWQLRLEGEKLRPRFPELEEQFAEDAVVQLMFVDRYLEEGDTDSAERCVRRAIATNPSFNVYQKLAAVEELRGDTEGWLAALDESLEHPVPGLEHARTRSRIAQHFLERDEPERALPYATGAARTGAAWAMIRAAEVHEALGQLDEAASYIRWTASRYRTQTLRWYFWSLRTGYGDFDEAAPIAREHLMSMESGLSDEDEVRLAIIELVDGDVISAYDRILSVARTNTNPYYSWFAAMLADGEGEVEIRDEMFNRVLELCRIIGGDSDDGTDRIAEYLLDRLAEEDGELLDRQFLDEEIARLGGSVATNMWYFLSQILLNHGQESDGLEYVLRAAEAPDPELWAHCLARYEARLDNQDVGETREYEFIPLAQPINEADGQLLKSERPAWRAWWSGDDLQVLSNDSDGRTTAWDPGSGTTDDWIAGEGVLVDVDPVGERGLLISGFSRQLEVWRPGRRSAEVVLQTTGAAFRAVRFDPADSNRLVRVETMRASETMPGSVLSLWSTDEEAEVWRTDFGNRSVQGLGAGAPGELIVAAGGTGGSNGWIGLFSTEDGSEVRMTPLPGHSVSRMTMSADRTQAATVSSRGEIIVWDLESLEPLWKRSVPGASQAALGSDGRLVGVAVGSEVHLYDWGEDQLLARVTDHTQPVSEVTFSSDGTRLASAGSDMTTRVWDVGALLELGVGDAE